MKSQLPAKVTAAIKAVQEQQRQLRMLQERIGEPEPCEVQDEWTIVSSALDDVQEANRQILEEIHRMKHFEVFIPHIGLKSLRAYRRYMEKARPWTVAHFSKRGDAYALECLLWYDLDELLKLRLGTDAEALIAEAQKEIMREELAK